MGRIIPLNGGDHEGFQTMLPWYVTGQVEADERAALEAHLGDCPECRAELALERRLAAEIAGLPATSEAGWARLKARVQREAPRAPLAGAGWLARLAGAGRPGGAWLGWALAAQVALLAVAALLLAPGHGPDRYRVLGAPAAARVGDALIMFRPGATEAAMRQALDASGARLVDGPTAAGAWLVRIEPAARAQGLERLRRRPDIAMAEPVDAAGPAR